MSVDFEAIAQRGHCDVTSLRLAQPLLEQGYSPPFLARYRRDELGGIDESSLWLLASALQTEREIASRREDLHAVWEATSLRDPALGQSISKSNSLRMLARLGRRLKSESTDNANDSTRLAVRVLNPQRGDGDDFRAIAEKVEGIADPDATVAQLDQALAKRLAGDPRIIAAAVRWLVRNARIHIASISDPHIGAEASADAKKADAKSEKQNTAADAPSAQTAAPEASETGKQAVAEPVTAEPESKESTPTEDQPASSDSQPASDASPTPADSSTDATIAEAPIAEAPIAEAPIAVAPIAEAPIAEAPIAEAPAATSPEASQASEPTDTASNTTGEGDASAAQTDSATETPAATAESDASGEAESVAAGTDDAEQPGTEKPATENASASSVTAENSVASEQVVTDGADASKSDTPAQEAKPTAPSEPAAGKSGKGSKKKKGAKAKPAKAQKKISPRQRRRRWLVGVLKPLQGKRFHCDKLSAFQIVMLGRALRSQVAQCAFEYDATKLVAELQRVAGGINRNIEEKLRQIVLDNESAIREAAETAWWDDLHERASTRLVGITADHLRRHVNRGAVDAKVVMAIDAVGPRTAATSIVSSNGRLLHSEDLPCQLSPALRSQSVARIGELIHTYHVDLIVISNGPAQRALMIALGDLIGQSPEKSVRWTLADRSGADVYASSSVANEEMRATPRRFRAAAWLAFAVLQPAQALAKVDPLKLRLSSFQRELSDQAMSRALEDVVVSGASRGGVDVNSAPVSWLSRLPGVSAALAAAIDARRREGLFKSRQEVVELDDWEGNVHSRQAVPFLRVFGGDEVLDGTLIHPEDYALARKLASALEIELPPNAPPGYVPPDFQAQPEPTEPSKLAEAETKPEPMQVEEFTAAGEQSPEFSVDPVAVADPSEGATSGDGATEQPTGGEETGAAASTEPAEAVDSGRDQSSADAPTTEPESSEAAPETPPQAEATDDSSDGEAAAAASEESPASDSDSSPADAAANETAGEPIPDPILRPRPERSKIAKCVKEWQIGGRRADQLVQWLCDPFGDSDSTDNPPAVLTSIPTTNNLKPGERVIGVVVGVMPFGVFVEIAPDCSGLIHVSCISDTFIEDLHEAIQVGDVVTAWVTGIDEKRRRVALSAVSPEREAERAEAKRQARDNRAKPGGPRRRGGNADRGPQPSRAGAGAGTAGGGRAAGQQGGGNRSRTGQERGGNQARGNQGGRGGRGGGRDGGRGRDTRGRGREKKPESYRVVGKAEAKPISDAMQKGDEPLRSFGDLMQFFDSSTDTAGGKPEANRDAAKSKEAAAKPKDTASDTPATPESVDSPANTGSSTDGGASQAASGETASSGDQVTSTPSENAPKDPPSDSGTETPQTVAAKVEGDATGSDQTKPDSPSAESSPADAPTS